MALAENLILLRHMKGFTQEQAAKVAGVSRQSYAKWEKGTAVPDIEKCNKLAVMYGVRIDTLVYYTEQAGAIKDPPAENETVLWGIVKVGPRGQLVLSKDIREAYQWKEGERVVVLGGKEGISILSAGKFEQKMRKMNRNTDETTNYRNDFSNML